MGSHGPFSFGGTKGLWISGGPLVGFIRSLCETNAGGTLVLNVYLTEKLTALPQYLVVQKKGLLKLKIPDE
jgi:hypothetical protein